MGELLEGEDRVRVELGERSYDIRVVAGGLDRVGAWVEELGRAKGFTRRVALVTDTQVGEIYEERVEASLRSAGLEVTTIRIPPGEEHKNLAYLAVVYDRLVDARVDRTTPIVALGGGVIGDLAGLAAATFLRGVPFIQVPTTLLAQVDASVGGKTAVNHPSGKNLIGAFHQPSLVAIDPESLRTLDRRQVMAGLAEVVKYAAILDAPLFEELETHVEEILKLEPQRLARIIARCCALKARVVEADEREGGHRAVLNFGHTLGHAVETLTEYRRYLHGEAVAIGMVCAARVSRARAGFGADEAGRLEGLLERLGLPTQVPAGLRRKALSLVIEADKKAAGGQIKFVCVEQLGRSRFVELRPDEIVELAVA